MKDRKFHIDKELKDNYPMPGVPADEAWAEMNKMLGPNLPETSNPGNRRLPGGLKKFFWHYVTAIIVVAIIPLAYHYIHNEKKTSTAATTSPGKNYVQDQAALNDTAKKVNQEIKKPAKDSASMDDSALKTNLPSASIETETVNRAGEKDTNTSLHNDITKLNSDSSNSFLRKNNLNITEPGKIDSTGNLRRNEVPANNTFNDNKEYNRKKSRRNSATATLHYGKARRKYHADKDKTINHAGNNNFLHDRNTPVNLSNHTGSASTDKHIKSRINISASSVPGAINAFIKEPIDTGIFNHPLVDSTYLQQMISALKNNKPKKHTAKSGSKNKNNKRSGNDFEYGLQWDVPIPIQGTTNYFTATNGKSKPYNILIPGLWVSKGLSNNSKVFLKINANQQYFIGNKKIEADTAAFPLDSTFHKMSLLKISGFGATLQYNYQVHKNWAVSIGFNYGLNRKALINKQEISVYTRRILADTLYGIKRTSADWQYIKNSQLTGMLGLYYTFKKFSLGAVVYVPLSNIPVEGNKNIHPLNGQLFLRWNIKKN